MSLVYVYFQHIQHTVLHVYVFQYFLHMCVHLYVSARALTNGCFHPNTAFPRRRADVKCGGLGVWAESWGIFPCNLIRPSDDVISQPWVTVVKTIGATQTQSYTCKV